MKWICQFQHSIPKPRLFAFYGALGGLLGALVVGEGLWLVSRPAPKPPPIPDFLLAVSPSVDVFQGGSNRLLVKVKRSHFDGAIHLSANDAVEGITVVETTIPAGLSEGELELNVAATVGTGPTQMVIYAMTEVGDTRLEQHADVAVMVNTPPPPPAALRMVASPEVVVPQGATNRVTVVIARDHFKGPVEISAGELPPGISLADAKLAGKVSSTELVLNVARDAIPGTFDIQLHGTANVDQRTLTGQCGFQLVVEPFRPTKIDVMFVLDITGSMQTVINGIRDGIVKFAEELDAKQFDARIGLLAFRDEIEGEESEQLRFPDEPFTNDSAEFRRQVGALMANGGGDEPESSLDAIAAAARLRYREDATKVLLLITDAPPKIPDKSTASVAAAAATLKEFGINQIHLVVNRHHRQVYDALRIDAKGQFFDLTKTAGGGNPMAVILPEISTAIAKLASRPEDLEKATLPPPPIGPPATGVRDLATRPPPAAFKSVQSTTEFGEDSGPRLLLAISAWTAVIAASICLVLVVGQNYYLREIVPPVATAMKAICGGLVAGAIGGAVGQFLFDQLQGFGGSILEAGIRLGSWGILGALVGMGASVAIPNLGRQAGILGGGLGGVTGALGFLCVVLIWKEADFGGRLIGATVLGFGIGLMLALAERTSRVAWLEFRYGSRETMCVSLGVEPVTIGGNSRGCTVYVRDARPLAYQYRFENGQVVCVDYATESQTTVANGSQRTIGNVTVTVRCGGNASAAPTFVLPRPVPPKKRDADQSVTAAASPATAPSVPGGKPDMPQAGRNAPPLVVTPAKPIVPRKQPSRAGEETSPPNGDNPAVSSPPPTSETKTKPDAVVVKPAPRPPPIVPKRTKPKE
ncbi:MAG: VWA domain-containing protein [Planctomycetota bacterium]|nr:VWA domain-containing protein [Planctomycetota bacterium]